MGGSAVGMGVTVLARVAVLAGVAVAGTRVGAVRVALAAMVWAA